jgi:endonuclease G, mitochondrial
MDVDLRIAEAAAQRWLARHDVRESKRAKLEAGRGVEVDTPDRVRMRLERLSTAATGLSAAPAEALVAPTMPSLVETIGLERVIGGADFLGVNFFELALAVSRFVGRIHIRNRPGRTAGFGTGFMVSPRLLLTNNHVLSAPQDAVHSEVEFDYQYNRDGRLLPMVVYGLEPQVFFLTSKKLDYTLVAVQEHSANDIEVRLYGWNRLIGEQGKAILGEYLNIIQHPKGEVKQVALRSNQLVDLLDDFAHYVTDTEPGSSGSPVYNDQWEVVALHHSGVPKKQDGNYIAKNGSIWKEGMDPDELDWVANEGIRVSSIVDDIKKQRLSREQQRLRDDLLNVEPPHPVESARMAAEAAGSRQKGFVADSSSVLTPADTVQGDAITWTIPLQVTVRLGIPTVADPRSVSSSVRPGMIDNLPTAPSGTVDRAPSAQQARQPVEPASLPPDPDLQEALAELEAAAEREYYNKKQDVRARDAYYKDLASDLQPDEFYEHVSRLLQRTHKNTLRYKPSVHLYPWVDLQEAEPKLTLKGIYSGKDFDPREFIEEDFRVEQERARFLEIFAQEATLTITGAQEQMDILEATLPFNCEHVVPQSWFNKREPMRGDLHHLFACESNCNSFRGNTPYFDFTDFEEVIRDDCGKREVGRFEPSFGKGVVARATLYFLLRYPKEINKNSKEYTADRIQVLLDWHKNSPVTRYEKHRNAAIFEKQGNRNPLIDFPDWADQIDFLQGLG